MRISDVSNPCTSNDGESIMQAVVHAEERFGLKAASDLRG